MNANVMNNNRGKLLAAVAVLAMIACVFVAIMPADNAEATDTSGVDVPAEYQAYVLDDSESGFTGYATLKGAIDAASDGATIYLNKNAATDGIINGDGVIIDTSVKSLTIDFNGLTYNMNGTPVGSSGTETQAFQLLTGGSVTMKDGKITGDGPNVKMLIQNYCNLTLNNMVVDATVGNNKVTYTVSNNCGNVVLSGATTIAAKTGEVAFDVCGYASYGGVSVTIADDFTGSINGKVEMTRTAENDNKVELNIDADVTISELDAQTGIVTIGKGADVKINTTSVSDGVTIVNNGNLDASYKTSDELRGVVSKDTEFNGTKIYDVVVNPGVTLTFTKDVISYGDMRLYGTIAPATAPTGNETKATLTVGQDATLTAYAGASVAKGLDVVSSGNGKIDLSAAMSTVTLNDDIESDFRASQSQKVVIADTLTIKSGYTMTILGELVINEGCTVIVEDGASLILGDKVQATGMTVNGTIQVEQGGILNVENAKDVIVYGQITSSGSVTINSNVTIKNAGIIDIDDTEAIINDDGTTLGSSITVEKGANFVVENGGALNVAGEMTIANIKNSGTVTLEGAYIASASKIQLVSDGAVLDIKSMSQAVGANLNVSDEGMYLYTDDDDKDVLIQNTESVKDHNIIQFKGENADVGVRNVTITAVLTVTEVDRDTTNYHHSLSVSGSVAIFDDTDAGDFPGNYNIAVSAMDAADDNISSSIEVPESLTLGKNIKFAFNSGVMNVDGSMTATADGSQISSKADIYVDGIITSLNPINVGSAVAPNYGINAFHYTDDDYNYYTTLKTSVDNGATDIEYIGNVTVLDSVTIPAGTEVTKATNGVRMTIGDGDHRDVVVTFTDGATMRSSVVNVMGTLVFDNNKTGNRNNNITSDVIIDEEPKRTYTNIYTALSNAADGSTITIAPTTNVYLDKDAEIRETITLEVPAGSGLYLYNDVTLTVNGTLKNSGSVDNAYPDPDSPVNAPSADRSQCDGFQPVTSADDDRQPAAIVANGTVMSMTEMEYRYYYIAGAYYQMIDDQGSWYYITPVEQAAAVSNDVEKGAIEVFGTNTVGDVAFTGDETTPVTVTVTGTLNAGTVTLDRAGITVDGTFTGTAASSVGAVDAVNAKGFTVVDTYVDDTEKTYLTGNPVFADKDKDSSVTVATGTVNAGQIGIVTDDTKDAYIGFFAIAEGATLDVSGQYNRANASVDASKMTVDGTMNVANNGKVTITDALTVRGTFTVASADDNGNSAGIADIKKMYVGIAENKDKKFVDASAATVTSDETIASLATIYVSGESTITGDLTSNMQSTEFYVEDALWMTVYATSGAASELNFVDVSGNGTENSPYKYAYNFQPGDLDNSEFVYWADANGEQIIDGNAKVGDSDYQQVYANLNYDIYTITVFADPGIQAVYVDGKLMTSGTFQTGVDGMWAQGFRLSVAAGEHEITYKLGNYYSGEAKMTVNGTAVEGNTFTTSGTTTADKNVTIYLQGVQASGPETPSTTGGDDGMGLTDYLLIILVVLIVIMAIIVALRLMRS